MEKILLVHNAYQHRGGEDSVLEAEQELLRDHGHEVRVFQKTYEDLKTVPKWQIPFVATWSSSVLKELANVIKDFQPDVVHFHNTLPLISKGAYYVVRKHGIPVIQTLHNYRLICPGALLSRNEKICEDCVGKFAWRGVLHGCYRGSRIQTAGTLFQTAVHGLAGTLRKKVTLFIALTEFGKAKHVQGGFDEKQFRIKPNFLPSPPYVADGERKHGLFVGRISHEKGIEVLAKALEQLPEVTVKLAGKGDLQDFAAKAFGANYLGAQPLPEILQLMAKAAYLVLPSTWYEGFPRTIVEAFAAGLPVITSNLGSMAEVVSDGQTGLLFKPGDAHDLADKIRWAEQNPDQMARMGRNARTEFEAKYSPEANYAQLVGIYREAIALEQGK